MLSGLSKIFKLYRTFMQRQVLLHRSSQTILIMTSWNRQFWSHFTTGEKEESNSLISDFSEVTQEISVSYPVPFAWCNTLFIWSHPGPVNETVELKGEMSLASGMMSLLMMTMTMKVEKMMSCLGLCLLWDSKSGLGLAEEMKSRFQVELGWSSCY